MNLKYLIIGILAGSFSVSYSQQITVSVSEKTAFTGRVNVLNVGDESINLGTRDKSFALYRPADLDKAKHSITLLKYDKKMRLAKKAALLDGEKTYGPFYPELKYFNNKPRLFYYQLSESKENIDIFQAVVNTDSLTLSGPKRVLSMKLKNTGLYKVAAEVVEREYKFIVTQSSDLRKILLVWISEKNNRFFYSILDSAMNILANKEEMIADEKKIVLNNCFIDNAGNFFAGYNTNGIFIGGLNAASRTLTVEPDGEKPTLIFVGPGKNGDELCVAGTYENDDEPHAGLFSAYVTLSRLSASPVTKSAFPPEIKTTLRDQLVYGKKPKKIIIPGMEYVPIITAAGQLHILGRSRFKISHSGPGIYYLEKRMGSLVYARIRPEGISFSIIPRLTALDDNFYHCVVGNKIFLFYTDEESNLGEGLAEAKNIKTPNTMSFVAIVSEDGNIKREIIPARGAYFQLACPTSPTTFVAPAIGNASEWSWVNISVQ